MHRSRPESRNVFSSFNEDVSSAVEKPPLLCVLQPTVYAGLNWPQNKFVTGNVSSDKVPRGAKGDFKRAIISPRSICRRASRKMRRIYAPTRLIGLFVK